MSDLLEDLEDLYETAPCGYASLSSTGIIVKVNRTLCDWLGWNAEDLVGRPVHDILSFGGKIAFETHLAPLLRMQSYVYEIALDLVCKDSSKVPAIANGAEKRDSSGRHLFTRLTLFRATDRRTYERSLVEAKTRAEAEARQEHEAVLLREQLMAVLSHDLRNPLAAIASGIGLLRRRGVNDDRSASILEQMQSSLDRAFELIEDVLDFARGRLGGGLPVELSDSRPLKPALDQVVAEARTIAPDRIIELRMDFTDPIRCDPDRICQLTSNLLSNAIHHGASDSPIVVDARKAGGRFLLSVANGGDPIPAEARDKLFEPFFRNNFSSRNGLGLGLFIARQVAEAHHGSLEMTSDEDETRFTLTIPDGQQSESA